MRKVYNVLLCKGPLKSGWQSPMSNIAIFQ
jgi:hypothetical protein